MTTIWTEDKVTLINLAQHFEDCGKTGVSVHDQRVTVYTPTNLALSVRVDDERKFVRISSYLPTDRSRSREDKLEFIQRLNSDLILMSFSLDDDGDVIIYYYASFELGLLIGQFMIVLSRFGSIMQHIIDDLNEDGLIVFGQNDDNAESSSESENVAQDAITDAAATIDASRPKDVVLN